MNAVLTIVTWILLSILMVYAAVGCVAVFKTHCITANKVWKKHCCRVGMAVAVALPVLSVLKTIQLMCLLSAV